MFGRSTSVVECRWGDETYKIEVFDEEEIGGGIKSRGTPYERKELECIERLGLNGVFLDIGANIGNHSLIFSRIGATKVVAVDMNPETFALLNRNLERSCLCEWEACQVALGVGTKKMMIDFKTAAGGACLVGTDEVQQALEKGAKVKKAIGEVTTTRLDMAGFDDAVFVKIDVEGQEGNVFRGGRKYFSRCRPIIMVECWSAKKMPAMCSLVGKDYESVMIPKTGGNHLMYPPSKKELVHMAMPK